MYPSICSGISVETALSEQPKSLANKKLFITGASSGIGQGIALAYARAGADVIFSYQKNRPGADETLKLIQAQGVRAMAIVANLEEVSEVYALAAQVIETFDVDILINNAGTLSRHQAFTDIPLASFEKIQAVNLRAPFILTQEMAKHMRTKGIEGSIINISSGSARIVSPGLTHYECSKAALEALTRGAANSLAPYRIRVNAIAPGLVATDINRAQREQDPASWAYRTSKIPLGRFGTPEDIAQAAIFLGSDASRWITGAILDVDGGLGVLSPFGHPPPKPPSVLA